KTRTYQYTAGAAKRTTRWQRILHSRKSPKLKTAEKASSDSREWFRDAEKRSPTSDPPTRSLGLRPHSIRPRAPHAMLPPLPSGFPSLLASLTNIASFETPRPFWSSNHTFFAREAFNQIPPPPVQT
ncbi:unnamed protein product, partial [Laminaria digitata]